MMFLISMKKSGKKWHWGWKPMPKYLDRTRGSSLEEYLSSLPICPNDHCNKGIKCILKGKERTWANCCPYCKTKLSQEEMNEKCNRIINECIAKYEVAANFMEEENCSEAICILSKAIDVFHEVAQAPHKETHIAQEALRSCFADFGNVHNMI